MYATVHGKLHRECLLQQVDEDKRIRADGCCGWLLLSQVVVPGPVPMIWVDKYESYCLFGRNSIFGIDSFKKKKEFPIQPFKTRSACLSLQKGKASLLYSLRE